MSLQSFFIIYVVFFIHCCGIPVLSNIHRPIGVSIMKAALYKQGEIFTCLDGLKTINFTYVNDDFCDCQDGSDEPGTSACPNAYFHCNNHGHKSKSIPSGWVNDRICDCCDGTDEYSAETVCTNNCAELGNEERRNEKERLDLIRKGNQIRNQLCTEGKNIKTNFQNKLEELNQQRQEAETIKDVKLKQKEISETAEKDALDLFEKIHKKEKLPEEINKNLSESKEFFVKTDINNDGFIEASELQQIILLDQNQDGKVDELEAKYYLNQNERINEDTFVTYSWPLIKSQLMLSSGIFQPPNVSDNNEPAQYASDDDDQNDDINPENVNEDEAYEEIPKTESEETDSTQPEYDEHTQQIVNEADIARKEYSEAERVLRDIETEINNVNKALERDYGTDDEFAPLNGECFEFKDQEYIYKLCPFDKTSQQPIAGGTETRLGVWENWSGKDNKYIEMSYKNGEPCWNGPKRSTTVSVVCGLENKLLTAAEPSRCEYHFNFQTPAVCVHNPLSSKNLHEEL